MKETLSVEWMPDQQDQRISEAVAQESTRLRNFISRRVSDPVAAEDILQDAFYELVVAYRLAVSIEHVGAWLFRVARNRITDAYRKKKPDASTNAPVVMGEDAGDEFTLEDLLPSPDAGPEAAYAHNILVHELEEAFEELPAEQREVFVANELEGRSFKELAAESGVSVNTLLSRKRYAVKHLRRRLQGIYDDLTNQ
jgi:RNA polymerase sigma factor (sigma-70 family)